MAHFMPPLLYVVSLTSDSISDKWASQSSWGLNRFIKSSITRRWVMEFVTFCNMPGQYRGPELVIQTPAPANSSTGFRATDGCKYHHEYLAVYEQLRQEWERRLQEGRGVHFVVRQAVWGHFPEWTSTLEGNAPTSWVQPNASQEIPHIPAVHPRCRPVVYSPSKIPHM